MMKNRIVLSVVFAFVTLSFTNAQLTTTVSAGSDQLICDGTPITLQATIGTSSEAGCFNETANSPFSCGVQCDYELLNSNESINTGDTVCVLEGNSYSSGNVNMNGGVLIICGTYSPSNFNFNGGQLIINGTATIPSLNLNNTQSSIINYGNLNVSNFNINGVFENYGSLSISNDININGQGSLLNLGSLTTTSGLNNNGLINNLGSISVTNNLNNNGNGILINDCNLTINGNLYNNSELENNGVLDANNITYSWSPIDGLSNPNSFTTEANPTETTTYTLTASIPNGFSQTDEVTVEVNEAACNETVSDFGNKGYSIEPDNLNSLTVGKTESPEMFVYDRLGEKFSLEEIRIPDNSEVAGMFRVHFVDEIDGTSVGFDDPTLGAQRKDVVVQVLEDLSILLGTNLPNPYPGLASPCANASDPFPACKLIEIEVKESNTPINSLAYASQYFLDQGNRISYGVVWQYINTGFDPYYSLASTPLVPSSAYHARMKVNFDNIDWNMDLDNPPATTEFDLYTVVLHEMLHALGIGSLIDADGTSRLTNTSPGRYSIWDTFLVGSDGNSLIDFDVDNDCIDPTFGGIVSDLTSCPSVQFVGPSGVPTIDVYTGPSFDRGSSLSHLNCSNAATPGFVEGVSFAPGDIERIPNLMEAQILCALGYNVQQTYGNGDHAISTFTYTGNTCPTNRVVAGTNDFRPYTPDNSAPDFEVKAGETISINTILDNDNNAQSLSCLEILQGGAITDLSNITATGFDYNPPTSFVGTAIILYRPQSPSGVRGNTTFIFITVTPPDLPECVFNVDDCNLVCYGSFEEFEDSYAGAISDFRKHLNNSPDMFFNTHWGSPTGPTELPWACPLTTMLNFYPNPVPLDGNNYIGIGRNILDDAEGFVLPLNTALQSNHTYEVKYLAATPNCDMQLDFIFSENLPCPFAGSFFWNDCGTFDMTLVQREQVINPAGWEEKTFTITVPTGTMPLNHLVINAVEENGTNSYIYLDNIRVREIGTPLIVSSVVSDLDPCFDETVVIDYSICLDGVAATNATDIQVELRLPNGVSVLSGDFSGSTIVTIPANTLTTTTSCFDLSAVLVLDQNQIIPGANLPIELVVLSGNECIPNDPDGVTDLITPTLIENLTLSSSIIGGVTNFVIGDNLQIELLLENDGNVDPLNGLVLSSILPTGLMINSVTTNNGVNVTTSATSIISDAFTLDNSEFIIVTIDATIGASIDCNPEICSNVTIPNGCNSVPESCVTFTVDDCNICTSSFYRKSTIDGQWDFGQDIVNIGDLDGDGVEDLVVTLARDGGNYWPTVIFMNADGTEKSQSSIEYPGVTLFPVKLVFGQEISIAHLGDLDGPGGSASAIAVGYPGDDDGLDQSQSGVVQQSDRDRGAVVIVFLNTDGSVFGTQKISQNFGGFTGTLNSSIDLTMLIGSTSSNDSDNFGNGVANLGDLDGPGGSALAIAVGAPGSDFLPSNPPPFFDPSFALRSNEGAVYILFLNTDGTVASHTVLEAENDPIIGQNVERADRFGSHIEEMGDLDGPGGASQYIMVSSQVFGGDRYSLIVGLDPNGNPLSAKKVDYSNPLFNGQIAVNNPLRLPTSNFVDLGGVTNGVGTMAICVEEEIFITQFDQNADVFDAFEISPILYPAVGPNTRDFGNSAAYLGDLDGDGFIEFAVGSMTTPAVTDPGQVYIISTCEDLSGLISSPAPLKKGEVLESVALNKVFAVPSVTKDFVMISGIEEATTVKLVNAHGYQTLLEVVLEEDFVIDLSDYSSGTYILQYQNSTGMHTEKVIKL